jgi:chitinase
MTSLTPMIGQNDNPAEILQLSDATNTVSFAKSQGIGELGFWAESRDHTCVSGETNYLCSGISESAHQFASIFDGFNN